MVRINKTLIGSPGILAPFLQETCYTVLKKKEGDIDYDYDGNKAFSHLL